MLQLKQDLVREELAMMGAAIEEYSIDYKAYPSTGGAVAPTESIAKSLVPVYLDALPVRDPFGGHYRYWSDGMSYALISPGRDGALDADYRKLLQDPTEDTWKAVCRGASEGEGVDVVWANGRVCQWPVGRKGG